MAKSVKRLRWIALCGVSNGALATALPPFVFEPTEWDIISKAYGFK